MDNTAMLLSFTIVVFFSAILLAFAHEFSLISQKVSSIFLVKLLLPLIVMSWLIERYEHFLNELLRLFQDDFNKIIQHTAAFLPFQTGSLYLIRVAYLIVIACFPVWMFWLNAKRKKKYGFPLFPYYLGTVLWIVAAFLLTSSK